jgi:hypothetical protein
VRGTPRGEKFFSAASTSGRLGEIVEWPETRF